MPKSPAYDDAIDLLDADHKAVKKMFIDYSALVDDEAPGDVRRTLALSVCEALTVHSALEEEIFYPEVRKFIHDDPLMDEALQEHAQAKELIGQINHIQTVDSKHDELMRQLGKAIDTHVAEEREQIFLRARYAPMDLKALVVPLLSRKQKLSRKPTQKSSKGAA